MIMVETEAAQKVLDEIYAELMAINSNKPRNDEELWFILRKSLNN